MIATSSGMYGYYDRMRSDLGNYFSQGTAGIEFMSVEWDFRVNGYFPQTAGERIGTPIALYNGNTFIVETPYEYAYYGTDLEVGKLLATTTDGTTELRGFATAYYFDRDVPGYEEIAGGRLRMEMRMYDVDWLGAGSRVMLGAQYQYDEYRKSVGSGLLSVRIPFGSNHRSPDRLQRRIVDSIVRDNDIVTRQGKLREIGIDPTTGNPFISTTVLDGSTDAVAQVAAAQPNTMIVANGDEGPINVAAPLVLKSGQIFRPGGFIVQGKQTGSRVIFGSPGTIIGTNPGRNVIVLADNVELFDLRVHGGSNTVFGDGVVNLNIHDNRFVGGSQTGLMTLGTSQGEIVRNVIDQGVSFDEFRGLFSRNTVDANPNFAIRAGSINGTIVRNTFTGDSAAGAVVNTMTSGSFSNNEFTGTLDDGATFDAFNSGSFSNNTFANVTNRGLAIATMSGGTVSSNDIDGTPVTGISVGSFAAGTITQNFVNGATQDGFMIGSLSGGTLDSNSARSSGRHGFYLGAFTAGSLTNNIGNNNAGSGFEIDVLNTSIVDGLFSGNSARNNTTGFNTVPCLDHLRFRKTSRTTTRGDGFRLANITDALRMDNNVANNNGGNGYYLDNVGSGFLTANTGSNNAGTGMLVAGLGTTFVTDGTFNSNGAGGMILGDMLVGNVSNNTARNNTGSGISLGIINNGSIRDNTASGNTLHGFNIADFDFGTIDNNTAEFNGGNGFHFAEMTSGTLREVRRIAIPTMASSSGPITGRSSAVSNRTRRMPTVTMDSISAR